MREQLDAERLEHEMRIERSAYLEQPAIYVVAASGDEQFFDWVAFGAEEEGVPCRRVRGEGSDPFSEAFVAAQASRIGVGVAVAGGRVVLQETHMTAEHPVLAFTLGEDPVAVCRLAGSNAGRLVKRMPLRFEDSLAPAHRPRNGSAGMNGSGAGARNGAETADAVLANPDLHGLVGMIVRTITRKGLT